MSSNPEVDGILALRPGSVAVEPPAPAPSPQAPPPNEAPQVAHVASPAARALRRGVPGWVVPLGVAAIGLIASGTLGYFLYSTVNQRDAARHDLASTQATLASTRQDLSTAQSDAAARKAIANYVSLYVADDGRVQTDYQTIVNCQNYGQCRTAAQQLLTDMQAFQADRASATVPRSLTSSDSMLGDALSAAIAGDQEFITGIDNNDNAKLKEGGNKVDAAMLSLAKAESTLGAAIR